MATRRVLITYLVLVAVGVLGLLTGSILERADRNENLVVTRVRVDEFLGAAATGQLAGVSYLADRREVWWSTGDQRRVTRLPASMARSLIEDVERQGITVETKRDDGERQRRHIFAMAVFFVWSVVLAIIPVSLIVNLIARAVGGEKGLIGPIAVLVLVPVFGVLIYLRGTREPVSRPFIPVAMALTAASFLTFGFLAILSHPSTSGTVNERPASSP